MQFSIVVVARLGAENGYVLLKFGLLISRFSATSEKLT
jgi:hypothetical protein